MPEITLKHYTDSVYYDIEQTAKYCRALGAQLIEAIYPGITADEVASLDAIYCNPQICQRDLAKLILKDRPATGRVLDSLEKKGLINRFGDTKNNRLVRRAQVTAKGIQTLKEVTEKLNPTYDFILKTVAEEEKIILRKMLKKMRESLSEVVKMQI